MNETVQSERVALIPRIGARLVDGVLLTGINVGLGQVLGFGYDWLALTTLIVLAYFAGLDTLVGTTAGKRLVGLGVIGPDGGRPTAGQAVKRELFTVLGSIPYIGPLLALVAWIWILVSIRSSPLGQGKHDEIAGGTQVVRI